jgi:hypothetical protein
LPKSRLALKKLTVVATSQRLALSDAIAKKYEQHGYQIKRIPVSVLGSDIEMDKRIRIAKRVDHIIDTLSLLTHAVVTRGSSYRLFAATAPQKLAGDKDLSNPPAVQDDVDLGQSISI